MSLSYIDHNKAAWNRMADGGSRFANSCADMVRGYGLGLIGNIIVGILGAVVGGLTGLGIGS